MRLACLALLLLGCVHSGGALPTSTCSTGFGWDSTECVACVSVVANRLTVPGYAGDGGPATEAKLHLPYAVAVDMEGDIYITDVQGTGPFARNIRKVTAATGIITTWAPSSTVNGNSFGVLAAADGNIYFTSTSVKTGRGMLHKYDTATKQMTQTFVSTSGAYGLAIHPVTGLMYVVSGRDPGELISINITTSRGIRRPSMLAAILPAEARGIAFTASGEAFVTASGAYKGRIFKWSGLGQPELWNEGSAKPSAGVTATDVLFPDGVPGIDIDFAGNMLLTSSECKVWLVDAATGKLRLVAGTDKCALFVDPGNPQLTMLSSPLGAVFGPSERYVIFADSWARRVLKVVLDCIGA